MKWQGFHIPIIILSLLGGLALFFGGQFLYIKYNVEQPLERIIASSEYVQEYQIEEKAGVILIEVEFAPGSQVNIAESYNNLHQQSKEILGRKSFDIELKDKPDTDLEDAWRRSQYSIHQSIMLGNFPEMAEEVEKYAEEKNAFAKVYVDHDNIYVQMYKDDGHNLLRVVARQKAIGGETVDKRN